jgi:hypothetical protein
MADIKRSDKLLKKDQRGVRAVREEMDEQIRGGSTKPLQANPNRDRARGDWDRTGIHRDEGMVPEE